MAWVTGAGGLIGSHLVGLARECAPAWEVRGLTRRDLDLTDFAAVRGAFERDRPGLVIHAAALSRTPACEAEPALARLLNVEVTRVLAEAAADARLVFLSSDLVFDGRAGNYDESATPHPLNVYAETKVAAEQIVRSHPRHLVVRTSLNAGISPTGDRAFNEALRRSWEMGREVTLFTDEFRNPIPAEVTARAVWTLVVQGRTGLFHVAGSERLSRWEIGRILAERWRHLSPRLVSGSLRGHGGPARSPDTTLNCARAQAVLPFPLPRFSQWVAEGGAV
ncbi:MAG TPA: SDR family oxidoreductase [Methylomirabilota bacterium]|nr:SDR family oxidoreductase [Methylomirabilota bacterium]